MAWNEIKFSILNAAEQVVDKKEQSTKKPWMTLEIINLTAEKRSYKSTNPPKYTQMK